MYFDLEEHRPDIPLLGSPWSTREGVMLSIILHLLFVILVIVAPSLPFVKAAEARRLAAIEEARKEALERQRENARFVFVQPHLDTPAPKPPQRYELSDIDRKARTVERAPNPTNSMPFSRGNSPERIEAAEPAQPRGRENAPPQPQPDNTDPTQKGLQLPDSLNAQNPRSADSAQPQPRGPAVGVLADAIRNVQKYAQKDGFVNLKGGADQDFGPAIQFDTKGVEFGPWIRRFIAQIRRNWFVPYAAMSLRGHVVITFYVDKATGRITDLKVIRPSDVESFNNSAYGALTASNPTQPLPPEYPDDRAFFTVTFYFNEDPGR